MKPKVVSRTIDMDVDEASSAKPGRERLRVERHEDVTVVVAPGSLVVVGVRGDERPTGP